MSNITGQDSRADIQISKSPLTAGPPASTPDPTAEENRRVDALTGASPPKVDIEVRTPADLAALREAWSGRDSIPCVLNSREEGADHGWLGLDVRTLLGGDHSSGRFSVHDIVLASGAGLPAHFHEFAHSYLYLVDGVLDLRVGDETERCEAGVFGYAPPLTRLGARNPGPGPARILLAYTPAAADRGFADAHAHWLATRNKAEAPYLEILARYGFNFDPGVVLRNDSRVNEPAPRLEHEVNTLEDFMELRRRWAQKPAYPRLRDADAAPGRSRNAVVVQGTRSNLLINGDEDSGSTVIGRGRMNPGYAAPPHHQPTEEELFYILDGELTLTCGSVTRRLLAGGFGFAPRFATHGFKNTGPEVNRLITMNSPAGHERGFEMYEREGDSPRVPDLVIAHGWRIHG